MKISNQEEPGWLSSLLRLLAEAARLAKHSPASLTSDQQISRLEDYLDRDCISLAVVLVLVSKPATPVGVPVASKTSVLSGVTGGAKLA